ncbi:MAG: glycosyltransferase family 4 protein [bacterium]
MRILWFVNTPFPEVVSKLHLKGDYMGTWMSSLKQALIKTPGFQSNSEDRLGIACTLPNIPDPQIFHMDKVSYFCIPKSRMSQYTQDYKREISHCIHVVNIFDPDIVHVHGTEEFYGLVTERTEKPVVISIQGILNAIVRVYFENMRYNEILKSPRMIRHYFIMCRKARTERRIFRANHYFIGRTQWDKAQMISLVNSKCTYYQCDEVMDEEFYKDSWSMEKSEPFTIACTSSPYAYKGIHSILEAMTYLINRLPDARLNIYGSFPPFAYGAFLRKKIQELGLTDHVRFCGFKNSKDLAMSLKKARVFVMASYMENSSNSLQEAMLLGVPSVVSYTGGIPSIAEHGKSCLMFSRGDAAVMADCLYRIITGDNLSRKISEASRIKAYKRNNPEKISKELLEIYKDVIIQKGKLN